MGTPIMAHVQMKDRMNGYQLGQVLLGKGA